MSKKIDKIMTPKFRVSFPQVFEAKAAMEGGKEKYSLVMLFDKKTTDITAIKELIKRTVAEKYPNKVDIPKGFSTPIKDGDEKTYAGYQGAWTCTASSQYAPGVLDECKVPIINQKDFYAGCYAIATINAYCWSYMGKAGVSLGLQNIMKVRDGESLAGGSSAESDFDSIELPDSEEVEEVVGGGLSILD